MNAKHTTEPWRVGEIRHAGLCQLVESDKASKGFVCEVQSPYEEIRTANAARIVACVNALVGIADPAEAIKAARDLMSSIAKATDNIARNIKGGHRALACGQVEELGEWACRALALLTPKGA